MEMEEILKEAAKAEIPKEEKKTDDVVVVEPTEEQIEAALIKKFGTGFAGLIKKDEQVVVLSEEEKKKQAEEEETKDLIYGLEKKLITKEDTEAYTAAKTGNKIDLARKIFIDQNADKTPEEAGKLFDKIARLDEDDDLIEGEGEEAKAQPNVAKKESLKFWESLVDKELEEKYGKKIKNIPLARKAALEQEALERANTEIINKALAEIPRKLEKEVAGEKYGIVFTDEDFNEARKLVEEIKGKKGIDADEIKKSAATYLVAKNVDKIIEEGIKVGLKKLEDKIARGEKGIPLNDDDNKGGTQVDEGEALLKRIRSGTP